MTEMTNTILEHAPDTPDPTKHYLFYLHGLIVEVAGNRPKSEEHGYYEYQLILEELAGKGFVVISEARKKDTQVKSHARVIAAEINMLLQRGVLPENITVVGASKGGAIVAYASAIVKNSLVNYVYLAGLFEKYLVDDNLKLYGNVLSIHDRSDKLGITPQLYFQRSHGLGSFLEIILDMGKGHGIIYKPYRQWVEPILQWLEMK